MSLRCLLLLALIGFIIADQLVLGEDDLIDVDLSYIDSPLIDIVWCGEDRSSDDNVLVLSSKGSVYRSADKGHSWDKMAEVFHRKGLLQIANEDGKVGVVNKIQRSPVDPQLVIFLGTESVNWISPDCGETINAIGTSRQMREFQFHPRNKEWIMAASWSKCPPNKKDCYLTKDLMLSQDMGLTWKQISSYINQFSWYPHFNMTRAAKTIDMLHHVPEKRILVSFEPSGSGHQKLSGWNMKTHFFFSDDFLKTRTMIVNQGNKFLLTANFLFVAQVMNAASQEVTLLVANPNAEEYNFNYVQLPETLKEHSYTILDTSEGQVFININHLKPSSPMGTIYISDSTGTRFSLSLSHNVRTDEGQCDFEKVLSLEGIYLANVYHKEQADMYQAQYEDDLEITREQEHTQKAVKESDLSRFKQSRISFDKGAIWEPLDPPVRDSLGSPIICDPANCSLHLHSVSTRLQFGPFYSTSSSVGVVIGTGNVGKYLSYRVDQTNTYLSRDGGLTWFEIAKGSHIYEIGDHGGIIVLAEDQFATNILQYSWNEGIDWWQFQFSETAVEITNIITEPSNTATRFILYGTTTIESNEQMVEQGVIITIDFEHLHTRQCEGIDNAGDVASDYEEWTPNGKINPECLMGKKVTYVRRKRDSQCWNGEDMERVKFVEKCSCTEEDWECDLGFHREDGTGPCIRDGEQEIDYTYNKYCRMTSPPAKCSDFYQVTTGYRKVAGNLCDGGVQHQPIRLPCPGFRPFQIDNYQIWDVLLLVIFGAIVYFVYQNRGLCMKKKDERLPLVRSRDRQLPVMNPREQQQEGLGYREFDEELLEESEKGASVPTSSQLFKKR